MSTTFTKSERHDLRGQSLKIIFRLVRELPLLIRVFPIYVVCMLGGILLPQLFLWMSGKFASCDIAACQAPISYLNYTLTITPLVMGLTLVVAMILRTAAWIVFELSGQWSALGLYSKLVGSVSNVRTTFFDEIPSGKLINRLVRDFESLRMSGVIRLGDFVNALAEVLVAAGVVAFTYPLAALFVAPTLVIFLYIQFNVAEMVQRCAALRSVRFGEVLHRETDLIEGARTFVLYDKTNSLAERLRLAMSNYIQAHLITASVEAWGRFWNAFVSSSYSFVSLVCVSYALHKGTISSLLAGVIMTVVFRLSPSFTWLSWISAYLLDTVAVARRIFEFVDLPEESAQEKENAIISKELRVLSGDITFSNFCMSYRADSPVILKDLSVTFKQSSRIGIVGRTGAGKSSVVQSLFRMVFVRDGDIAIGGTSIYSVDINSVRNLFSVVPQDPYLFEGTVRSNLDRANQYSNEELEESLRKVGVSFPLSMPVVESGKNMSLGERQLLCLARTIVTKRPYIIMDEPTSGVDAITDAKIQEVLATALKDCTVIAIAHRLETLTRYDTIVEFEAGKVKRQGPPSEMLSSIALEAVE